MGLKNGNVSLLGGNAYSVEAQHYKADASVFPVREYTFKKSYNYGNRPTISIEKRKRDGAFNYDDNYGQQGVKRSLVWVSNEKMNTVQSSPSKSVKKYMLEKGAL